jgi:hypothetical protein
MGKELALDFAGGVEVVLELDLILARLFIEPGIFERHRDV